MKQSIYKPMSEKNFQRKYGDDYDGMSYQEFIDFDRKLHEERVGNAQLIILQYTEELKNLTGDREAVSRVRNKLREDEAFWKVCGTVVDIVEGEISWISNIFRAEAKRTSRVAQEKFEQIRRERAAEKAAEIAAENAELEAIPTFGMF